MTHCDPSLPSPGYATALFIFLKTGPNWFVQGFRQFCKVADMFVKALDVTYFWRRKAPFERLKRELPRGV